MNPLHIFGIKVAGVTLAIGFLLGGYFAHLFYAPRLDLAEERVDRLADALDTQNKAVEGLQKAAKERERRAKAAVDAAETARMAAEAAAEEILNRPPPAGVDLCTAASALITQELAK